MLETLNVESGDWRLESEKEELALRPELPSPRGFLANSDGGAERVEDEAKGEDVFSSARVENCGGRDDLALFGIMGTLKVLGCKSGVGEEFEVDATGWAKVAVGETSAFSSSHSASSSIVPLRRDASSMLPSPASSLQRIFLAEEVLPSVDVLYGR